MKKNSKYFLFVGIIVLLIVGYLIADSILFTGIRPVPINENGFQANYYAERNIKNKPAIILVGGGPWGNYWGKEFAMNEMVGLSIPYSGKPGLPELPEEIELEYFERAIQWLREQAQVDPDKIIVMGASRNAELALLLASTFPELICGVIAYAPGSVTWSNTVLPFNSDELKPSWKYKGKAIPYIPMEKISAKPTNKIETLEYWKKGLAKTESVERASIQVEKIKGPILLFSGKDDKVWPSSVMADMIEKRLAQNNFKYSFQNIQYENAGHLISNDPDARDNITTGILYINGKEYEFEYGGDEEGDYKAKQDAKIKLMEFLQKI